MKTIKVRLLEYCQRTATKKVLVIIDSQVSSLYASKLDFQSPYFICYYYVIGGSESSKSIDEVTKIWQFLLENSFSKDDLVLNVGGGTICDIGGFAAATYKRGIPCINVPTTLLAMTDAAYGGKNGINLGDLKNAVGTISMPQEVWRDERFLSSLSQQQLLNGFAEILKCALIANAPLWNEMKNLENVNVDSIRKEWIDFAVDFKQKIVAQDLNDTGLRHLLNFGHTMGHAYESYFLSKNQPLPHGFCVAYGIVDAAEISYRNGLINNSDFEEIRKVVRRLYGDPKCKRSEVMPFCKQDKKNRNGKVLFVLLEKIGSAKLHCEVNIDSLQNELA